MGKKMKALSATLAEEAAILGDDKAEDVPMIVCRQPVTENGVQTFVEHRVPVAEWADYEREHNL